MYSFNMTKASFLAVLPVTSKFYWKLPNFVCIHPCKRHHPYQSCVLHDDTCLCINTTVCRGLCLSLQEKTGRKRGPKTLCASRKLSPSPIPASPLTRTVSAPPPPALETVRTNPNTPHTVFYMSAMAPGHPSPLLPPT